MTEYLEKIMIELPDKYKGAAVTPAANHLFEVNENAKKLPEDGAQVFHSMVAKLLFLSKRSRPDILTSISFLTTRVREPDEDDNKRRAHTLKYLNATKGLVALGI